MTDPRIRPGANPTRHPGGRTFGEHSGCGALFIAVAVLVVVPVVLVGARVLWFVAQTMGGVW